jgi:hypothetical protein
MRLNVDYSILYFVQHLAAAHCNVTAFLFGLVIPQPAFHHQCYQWKL